MPEYAIRPQFTPIADNEVDALRLFLEAMEADLNQLRVGNENQIEYEIEIIHA